MSNSWRRDANQDSLARLDEFHPVGENPDHVFKEPLSDQLP